MITVRFRRFIAGFCDRTLVMYGGQIGRDRRTAVLADPSTPYTSGLLKAGRDLDRDEVTLATIAGEPPDMSHLPSCPFSPLCTFT
jgi:oligopeptide transport system ATP-binding protein